VRGAQAIFIAVGTPTASGEERADLSFVFEAARQIADVIDGYVVIVTKSTVPVGPATRSSASSPTLRRRPGFGRLHQNSCARARRSKTSNCPTAS